MGEKVVQLETFPVKREPPFCYFGNYKMCTFLCKTVFSTYTVKI